MSLPLRTALDQCLRHAQRLDSALRDSGLPRAHPPAAGDEALVRALDQAVYRYTKLQDTLGEHVLRAFCTQVLGELVEDTPLIDVLNRLDKRGYVDKEAWLLQRRLRNALTHEYPDQPERQLALLNHLPASARQLTQWLARFAADTPPAAPGHT